MKNSKNCWTVYCHTSPSGKRYIGITSDKPEHRWRCGSHYKKGTAFRCAIDKYGWENIKHEILDTNLDEFEAKCLEEYYIFSFRTFVGFSDCNGYNCTLGGEGTVGRKPTEEEKNRISESLKGKPGTPHTKESKRKISESRKGKKFSQETCKKISESKKGSTPWNKGISPSEETRRRISESNIGKTAWNSGKKTGISPGNKGKHLVMIDGKRHYE